MDDLSKAFTHDLEFELSVLLKRKKKLMTQVDNLDTEIIGFKEELRKRRLQDQKYLP